MKNYKFTLLLTALFLTLFIIPILAQEPTQEPSMDAVNRVASKLNCPTCQSLNLEDCRTQTCTQWRDNIKDLLAQGYTEQEVLDWHIARFGVEVLQEPPKSGAGLFAWLLPAVGLLAGTGWLFFIIKRWSKNSDLVPVEAETGATPDNVDFDDEYLQRIEQDLKDL